MLPLAPRQVGEHSIWHCEGICFSLWPCPLLVGSPHTRARCNASDRRSFAAGSFMRLFQAQNAMANSGQIRAGDEIMHCITRYPSVRLGYARPCASTSGHSRYIAELIGPDTERSTFRLIYTWSGQQVHYSTCNTLLCKALSHAHWPSS